MHELSQCNISYLECGKCEKNASWIAVFANLLLALFKATVGILSGSKAILGDSLYSVKDFFTSLVVLIGIRISGKPPDENHPYGHGKIEFVAIFLISLFLLIGTIFLFVHSVKDVWLAYNNQIEPPKFIAFWAALISVVANYKLSTYLHCVGSKRQSPAMLANAQHNHSDAISSALVAGAILGTRFGFYILDPLAAVIETIDLLRLSVGMINDSLKGMMDSSVSQSITKDLEKTASLVPGVKKITRVLARKVGQGIWVDITIKVDQHQTMDDGYKIGQHVEETLKNRFDFVEGINLSIEPLII